MPPKKKVETPTPEVEDTREAPPDAAPALGSAAERRADYMRALEEERGMCAAVGKAERVKAIDAEMQRVKTVQGRTTPVADEA